MFQQFFYKEWLKTKWVIILLGMIHIGMIIYLMLALRSTLIASGKIETIATMIGRDMLFITPYMYIPLISSVVLALVQWLPEMQQRRIRLTLHLPVSMGLSIGSMLAFSLFALLIMFGIVACLLVVIESIWLPRELIVRALLTLGPWFIAGLMGYSVTSWIILELSWGIRIVWLAIGAPVVYVCLISSQPACYDHFLPWLIVLACTVTCLPFYSVYRLSMGKGL